MAGVNVHTRWSASSLFETIVALMVIVIVFGIAMTIYVNVVRNSTSLSELKAAQRLEEIAKETKEKKSYFDESFKEDEVQIEKIVTKYHGNEALLLLELQALDQQRVLAVRKEIIEEANE